MAAGKARGDVGGIDLNEFRMKIKGDIHQLNLSAPPVDLNKSVNSLTPEILDMQDADLYNFLGLEN